MATPSRNDLMIRNIVARKRKKDNIINTLCEYQFPDCPKDRNYEECNLCPYWK